MSAIEALERVRRAIDDPGDPEHSTACAFRDAYGDRADVASFLDAYGGPAEVEHVAEAARTEGLPEAIWADDLNLALVTLMVDEAYRPDAGGEVIVGRFLEGEDSTQRTRESGEALARRLLHEIDEEHASESPYARLLREEAEARKAAAVAARERIAGPHIQLG